MIIYNTSYVRMNAPWNRIQIFWIPYHNNDKVQNMNESTVNAIMHFALIHSFDLSPIIVPIRLTNSIHVTRRSCIRSTYGRQTKVCLLTIKKLLQQICPHGGIGWIYRSYHTGNHFIIWAKSIFLFALICRKSLFMASLELSIPSTDVIVLIMINITFPSSILHSSVNF